MATRWVTADHHFGHGNIIRFCSRPFDSCLEMDTEMVNRWNEVVAPDDEVWHLGDFCLGGPKWGRYYLSLLNGRIRVVPGGHDRRWAKGLDTVSKTGHQVKVSRSAIVHRRLDKQHIVLCHYPLASWDGMHRGAVHFHGHTHSWIDQECPRRLNVCVDLHDFYPLRLDKAIEMAREG